MRKWRPAHKCLYVISEIHGNAKSLEIILNRIMPLRSSINQIDQVVFLGDYIDKGLQSSDVLNMLLNLQEEYPDRVFFLRGNHEELLLRSFTSEKDYYLWLDNGGQATITSYTKQNSSIPYNRLSDIIPSSHRLFLEKTISHFKIDNYIFFHGGINLSEPEKTSESCFIFDHSSSLSFKNKKMIANTPYIYIGAHNFKNKLPFISTKYLMLGGSAAPSRLTIFEMNSFQCSMIKSHKSRIYKHDFKIVEVEV